MRKPLGIRKLLCNTLFIATQQAEAGEQMETITEAQVSRAAANELRSAAEQHEARIDAAERASVSEANLASDFLSLALKGELSAVAAFAAPVYVHPQGRRPATLLDVLHDAVDHADNMERLFAFLLHGARDRNPEAMELLTRMAAGYGRRYAD